MPPTNTLSIGEKRCLFELHNVNVSYGGHIALHDISLAIGEGETVALIGASGAGKTTLLNKLYAMQADACAFVHQHYALVPQLSVFHNIYMGQLDRRPNWYNLLNLIKPRKRVLEEVYPILDTLGLREKIFSKVGALSGGQQQRVAVGRAMYRGGRVLLADEPVSSIDALQGEAVLNLILMAGKTVVAALHSVDFAHRFFGRIIGLCGGHIRFDLPAERVSQSDIDTLYLKCSKPA
jgi:phosphonate transport system ATP-binding protein